MKTILVIITGVSLALNLALVGLLFGGRNSEPAGPKTRSAPAAAATAPTADKPAADAEVWAGLTSSELPKMTQQLRDAGLPAHVVRAILTAQIRDVFAARRKAIDPGAESRPYWQSGSIDPKVLIAQRSLQREEQKILRDLLGSEAESPYGTQSIYMGRRLDSVPPEKITDVQQLLQTYDELRNDVYSTTGGTIGTEAQKRIAAIEAEQMAALGRILDPQELAEFNIRNSETARQLQYNLAAFNATEEEFRAIYKLQSQFDQQHGRMYGPTPPAEMQRRMDAQRQMTEEIKATLGPVRGAEYERANDFEYRQTSQLVARLELPAETTASVYAVQKDLQNRSREIYGPNVPPAERAAKVAQLTAEAKTKITSILGERGFEAYKQYGGTWMQRLTPTSRSSTGATIIRRP